ncbi:MAG: hypothetical protein MJ236_07540, partial [Clostridia bacterium]|nr:hypothetical protein [Clostridia bacterium]
KIVIIGGSSVPFGVNTDLLGQALGMPVVNFGLYATLGTKLMLDLSKQAINKDDIIVIAPETDPQTYSLFFNSESVWQACDSDFSILKGIAFENTGDMLGGYWKFLGQKIRYSLLDEHLNPSGVYNQSSFNEFCDISYDRPYNVMPLDYDTSIKIRFDTSIISKEFIDYVNEYVDYATKKGAKVLFSFAPMNEKAIDENTTMEQLEEFTTFIKENFKAELISNPNDYLYRSGYFYDSNFHMNNAGMTLHTRNLANDLAKALDKELLINIEKPKVPVKPAGDEIDLSYDANEVYFTFEGAYVGSELKGYKIVGVTDLGKTQSTLTTPNAYKGMRVFSVEANAFNGCDNLTDVIITKGITALADDSFAGARNLKRIHIITKNPGDITLNTTSGGLVHGMNSEARFYGSSDVYTDFVGSYFWGPYQNYLAKEG